MKSRRRHWVFKCISLLSVVATFVYLYYRLGFMIGTMLLVLHIMSVYTSSNVTLSLLSRFGLVSKEEIDNL